MKNRSALILSSLLWLVVLVAYAVMMTQIPDMQLAVIVTPVWLFILWLGYRYKNRK